MSEEQIDEKKKKKKKAKVKKDACYRKVKSRYDVWPSAYASGALVKCRKVGAKNWGNKSKNEEIELEEVELIPGGLTADLKGSMEDKHKAIADMHNISVEEINNQVAKGIKVELEHTSDKAIAHEIAMDHVFEDPKYYSKLEKIEGGIVDETQKETTVDEAKRKKAGTESSKESNLRDWFKRKGAKGSKGGWVDCNAPDGKGGYKACGRGSGEKRKRYPACRPTPAACKERGRGKSWGKKGSKRKRNEELFRTMVREEREKVIYGKTISEGLRFHITNDMPIRDNVYRHGTSRYFSLVNEARDLWKEGKLNLDEEDVEIMESDLGTFDTFAGQQVPLDFPMMIDESIDEAKKKKKKDPPIGKPTKNTGGGKKYKVYVRNPKTGKIKKITYGDSKGGLKGNWNSAEARKSFASRHNCKDKKDRTKAGYWACRAHKDFGTNVPGRFW